MVRLGTNTLKATMATSNWEASLNLAFNQTLAWFGAALLPCARAVRSRMLVSVGRVGQGVAHATLPVTRKPACGGCCVGDSGLAALFVPWSLVHVSIYRDSE